MHLLPRSQVSQIKHLKTCQNKKCIRRQLFTLSPEHSNDEYSNCSETKCVRKGWRGPASAESRQSIGGPAKRAGVQDGPRVCAPYNGRYSNSGWLVRFLFTGSSFELVRERGRGDGRSWIEISRESDDVGSYHVAERAQPRSPRRNLKF